MVALHHLDAPWRPCDVEQREGRILRQGNECEEIEIFRYVTEQSFDAYSWQTLETKARFIAQVMSGDKGLRAIEDVELATLSYAEVKALASGNPTVIEKAGVDAEVAKLSTLFSVWRNQRWANESEVGRLPMLIESLEQKLTLHLEDAAQVESQTMGQITVELGDRKIAGPDAVGDALRELVKTARAGIRGSALLCDQVVGRFGGFELGLQAIGTEATPTFFLAGRCRYDADPYQTQQAATAAQLAMRRKRLEDLTLELARPFEHEGRLTALLVRQRELLKQLDLDKDEAGNASLDGEAMRQAA